MAVLLCHCLTILWILGCVLVSSDARVLSKSCNNVESITLVNSTHLFGLPVECRDDCVLFAVSSSSVETCKEASDAKEVVDWKRCESSTASSLLVRSNDQHLCLLTTKQYLEKHSVPTAHHYVCADIEGCYSLLDAGGRHRREEAASNDTKQPINSWVTVVSSLAMIALMLLLLVMCVGGSKRSPPSSTSNIPGNVAKEGSSQVNVGVDSNQNNQKEIANQKRGSAIIMEPIVGDQNQEVQVAVENQESNRNEPQLADQDQPAVNQEQQLQEAVQNPDQQNGNQNNPNQDVQAAVVNGNNAGQQVDAEEARVPYGVVTIHSDQPEPANDNYAEVRNVGMSSEPSLDEPEDLTYDRVVDDSTTNENGYSTVVRDQIAGGGQCRPKRHNMYESVDEVLNREGHIPDEDFPVDDLEQDDTYERVPDTFREKVTSFTQSTTTAPQLPPMHLRTRKPIDGNLSPPAAARSSTLPIMTSPKLSEMKKRLPSSPSVNSKAPPPPSFPAPLAPPPSFPAPKPPTDDEEEEDELYARPELNPSNRAMSNPSGIGQDWVVQEEMRRRATTLPINATLSHPTNLGPLPEVPHVLASTGVEEEEPGYDTTAAVMSGPNYDHLNPVDEAEEVTQEQQPAQELQQQQESQQQDQQQQQEQQQQEQPQQEVEQASTPSTVKRDGLGYALPSKTSVVKIAEPQAESYYASVNITQKRLSQRKKQATANVKASVIATSSGEPPPLPPAIDLALVDDDIKTCPLTPPRLPESDELLVETETSDPPYARVNKPSTSSDLPLNEENIDSDDVDPYATVDIAVTGREQNVGLTMDREYDSIDNVMSPQEPLTVHISQIEGEYASVRSDATLYAGRATVSLQDSQGALSASQVPSDQTPNQEPVNGQRHNQQTTPTPQQTTGEVPSENTTN
ncbi:uncharacterized protein [Dysidea avara]|uniref:uncharacterized protein isoform X2 n=1 Tax=Dysidea avara TaxID=196820 RepID=UPI003329D8D4